jgi:predicted regulator of Ras-like GTPase activity (Roadblock/LC7/MglB family)
LSNDLYSFALSNTLNEIPKICADVKNTFIVKRDGQIVAKDEKTPEKTIACVTNALQSMLEKAEAIGSIENTVVECSKGRVNISCIDDLYVVTVTSSKADVNYVNSVTETLVSTVLRLVEKITPASLADTSPPFETETPIEDADKLSEEEQEAEGQSESQVEVESTYPEPQANQFMVEDLRGLFVKADVARIDGDILMQWKEACNGENIEEVEIETFDGKTTHCKIKPIKDSKSEGKGKIQMPDKVQAALGTKSGELVRVKPVVE